MVGWFEEEGLITDSPPVVGAQENAGDPHYVPTDAEASGDRRPARSCCWISGASCRSRAPSMPTSPGSDSRRARVPDRYVKAFNAARDGRDAAVALVKDASPPDARFADSKSTAPAVASSTGAGFGAQFIHRTGHSLGTEVHGNGVHMDDFETHDERRLIPGTGFTIEPGVYSRVFGVRTEINMFVGEREATVTGPLQTEFVLIRLWP